MRGHSRSSSAAPSTSTRAWSRRPRGSGGSIGSCWGIARTISFGLVSIPIKLYTAAASQAVSFNLLHATCGSRIKQQTFCPTCNEVV